MPDGGVVLRDVVEGDIPVFFEHQRDPEATRMALLSKFLDNQVKVLDELAIEAPRTKDVVGLLSALGLSGSSCLSTIENYDVNVWKSALAGVM